MKARPQRTAGRSSPLDRIGVVLVRPRFGGNIGACARAVKNMGLGGISLVSPDDFRRSEARMYAANASDVLEGSRTFDTITDAVRGCRVVLGTSRRLRSGRLRIMTPREAAGHLLGNMGDGTAAILFGPEDNGLTSGDLAHCHAVISIPAGEAQPSLNLAQAVMVVAYELRTGVEDPPAVTSFGEASESELEQMFAQMRTVLESSGFFLRNPEERVLLHLREILSRGVRTSQDARIIRGIFRRIAWALKGKGDSGEI